MHRDARDAQECLRATVRRGDDLQERPLPFAGDERVDEWPQVVKRLLVEHHRLRRRAAEDDHAARVAAAQPTDDVGEERQRPDVGREADDVGVEVLDRVGQILRRRINKIENEQVEVGEAGRAECRLHHP